MAVMVDTVRMADKHDRVVVGGFSGVMIFIIVLFFPALLANGFAPHVLWQQNQHVEVVTPRLRLDYHLETGLWDCQWSGGASIRRVSCMARLADGRELTPADYPQHECSAADQTNISDAFGKGRRIVVHHRGGGRPELRQTFEIYQDKPYILVRLEVVSPVRLASNYMAPLVVGSTGTTDAGLHLDTGGKPRTLFVPFDNDMFVRYNSDYASTSYETTAIYDDASRHGFVLGSISHDVWKTGLDMQELGLRRLGVLRVYGGATGTWTHDSQPHGMASGTTVASPRILVGYFADWRDGLETFGRANALVQPPLRWTGAAPAGWNSWYAYGTKVDQDRYLKVSEYVRANLEPKGFGTRGSVYINFDSFWDNLNELQTVEAVKHVHANGQKAGTYWTPFTYWGDDMEQPVPGTEGKYRFRDIVLKDAAGRLLPKLDNGHPVDPTHAGTLQWIDWNLSRFVRWGFDFIKLDFINAGALEGAHCDPQITTGMGAYSAGMRRIAQDLSPAKIGRPFFISLSIAPLFPSGYAHSRRISCDVGSDLKASAYMLNSLTYGWWEAPTLYAYNDPDMVSLSSSEQEARTRVNSCVITGAPLLDSDDLTRPEMQQRAQHRLMNPRVLETARSGRSFRPVEGNTGAEASDIFTRDDGRAGFLVAIFNYDKTRSRTISLNSERLGLRRGVRYHVMDLWSGTVSTAQNSMDVALEPGESKIFRFVR